MRSYESALQELQLFENEDPESIRAAGPSIGPIHDLVVPPRPELRKGVPAGAVLSPLAITLRGLRNAGVLRQKISQIVIHMTGSGPVSQSKKSNYAKPAIDYALNWYLNGSGGFPHYVVDFPGTIYATCDERRAAWHAGWVHDGGKARFQSANWKSPAWWTAVWGRFGFRSPVELLPKGASGPNSRSIGIELLITSKPAFTDAQYRALARLIADIARRHGIPIMSAPCPTLLGHEDYAPLPTEQKGRANASGGWDPGAHRTTPYFSWSKLWGYLGALLPPRAPLSTLSFEGYEQSRGVLTESPRTIDMEPLTVIGCVVRPSQAKVYPLMRLIPNVPFDRSKLPLTYQLDARKIVGTTANDIRQNGHKASLVIEAAHWGIVATEIFADAGVLAIAAPVLAAAAGFLALGSGCAGAAEVVAKDWAATGYSRGIVVAANGRQARELRARFGNGGRSSYPICRNNDKVARANYLMGLFVGYQHGRMLCPNQRAWFWRDLGYRMGDQSHLGPSTRWNDRDWTMWYVSTASAFRNAHLL